MAFSSIITRQGLQVYPPSIAENNFGLYLSQYAITKRPTQRIGYAYLFDTRKAAQGERFLIARGAVYIPGVYIPMPFNYDILGFQCQLEVKWDVSSVAINIYY